MMIGKWGTFRPSWLCLILLRIKEVEIIKFLLIAVTG